MKKATLFVVLLLTGFFVYSQDFEKNAEFFKDDKEAVIPKNKVKVNVLGPFYGYAAPFYERDFKGRFALEVGAGVTTKNFYRDYIKIFEFVDDSKKVYRNYDNRKQGYGLFFSVQPKILGKMDREGVYLGLQLQHLFTPYSAELTDSFGKFTGEYYKEKVNQTNLLFNVGYNQNIKKITFDYGFGYGVYRSNEKRFNQGYYRNSGSYEGGYETKSTRWGLLIDVQLKIGGIF